jgi:hypothetical protein
LQQAAGAVGIQADMPPCSGKTSRLTRRHVVARPGNRGSAEVQGSAVARAQRFHTARIEKFRQRFDGGDRCGDVELRTRIQGGSDFFQDRRRHHGFVALKVHDDILRRKSL